MNSSFPLASINTVARSTFVNVLTSFKWTYYSFASSLAGAYLGGGHCAMSPFSLCLLVKRTKLIVPSHWNMPDSFDGFCSLWPLARCGFRRVGWGVCIHPVTYQHIMRGMHPPSHPPAPYTRIKYYLTWAWPLIESPEKRGRGNNLLNDQLNQIFVNKHGLWWE